MISLPYMIAERACRYRGQKQRGDVSPIKDGAPEYFPFVDTRALKISSERRKKRRASRRIRTVTAVGGSCHVAGTRALMITKILCYLSIPSSDTVILTCGEIPRYFSLACFLCILNSKLKEPLGELSWLEDCRRVRPNTSLLTQSVFIKLQISKDSKT